MLVTGQLAKQLCYTFKLLLFFFLTQNLYLANIILLIFSICENARCVCVCFFFAAFFAADADGEKKLSLTSKCFSPISNHFYSRVAPLSTNSDAIRAYTRGQHINRFAIFF